MTTAHPSPRTRGTTAMRWRLPPNVRKLVLTVHLLAAGSWVGIDVVLGVLVIVSATSADPAIDGITYQALGMFAVGPMLTAALVALASGIVLGIGSKYGLTRYWWVAIKLALNLILCALILFALRPELHLAADHGRLVATGQPSSFDVTTLYFPPAVSLLALTTATALSVFKPLGRIRTQPRNPKKRRRPERIR